jgi:HD-like signal output (HDOD) protein
MPNQHNTVNPAGRDRVAALWKEVTLNTGPKYLTRSMARTEDLDCGSISGIARLLSDVGIARTDLRDRRDCPSLIELIRQFNQEIEFAPYATTCLSEQFEAALVEPDINAPIVTVLSRLRRCSKADMISLIPKLPMLPGYASEVLAELRREEASMKQIVTIASRDQVVAGALIACANSAANGAVRKVSNLEHAVSYIGTVRACRIVTACALKPALVAAGARDLWRHALEAAAVAEALGGMCDVPKADAFLLGLMHDIGRLLLSLAPRAAKVAQNRLMAGGCERAVAELLVYGMDHAEAGYLVLEHWDFPWAFTDAVRFHHEPHLTDSRLAALLHLVEFWTSSEEDPASHVRLNAALSRLGLTIDAVLQLRLPAATRINGYAAPIV